MSYVTRADAVKRIKAGLKALTGRTWNVRGDRGTAYGWIHVDAPAARRTFQHDGVTPAAAGTIGYMSLKDAEALGEVFKLRGPAHFQGHSIPHELREWSVAAAEGRVKKTEDGWEVTP